MMTDDEKKVVTCAMTQDQINALNALGLNPTVIDTKTQENDNMVEPVLSDGAQEQAIEPENIDKVGTATPFVRAQISTKNQMILRNILAVVSSVCVVIVFILEKLGVM